jgi:hypothetical protein
MSGEELLARSLTAHGGIEHWNKVEEVAFDLVTGGLATMWPSRSEAGHTPPSSVLSTVMSVVYAWRRGEGSCGERQADRCGGGPGSCVSKSIGSSECADELTS